MTHTSATTQPSCSIVIRCYNEEQHLGKLLNGILQQSVKDVEIILVDSGSTDGTLAVAATYPVRLVHINPEDFSFGRALNRGCEAATKEFIVIASAHIYPLYTDWLQKLLSYFADERIGLVYGKQSGDEQTKFSEHQIFAQWFPDHSNHDQSTPFCNNANAAIRRSLWQQIPYDEHLTGLEDLDWAKRAIQQRHRIAYSAEAEIIHVHNESYASILNRYRREAMALKKIIPEDRFTLPDFLRLVTANTWHDLREANRRRRLSRDLLPVIAFRTMQFWGTYLGFSRTGPLTTQLKQRFYYPGVWRTPQRDKARNTASQRIDYSLHLDGKA